MRQSVAISGTQALFSGHMQSRGVLRASGKNRQRPQGIQKRVLGVTEGFPEAVAFAVNLEGRWVLFSIYLFATWHTASVILVAACGFSS